ncbi:MAG: hypothetical protein NT066_00570 [Candidatus Omnitrophica bacterium]|nr:hypothetical protein [Candidatus Omnitrophota bacterium]
MFIVLGTIFIVITLGNIILSIISSQSRLTHHQVSRIQSYYAAMAGVNYALEMVRLGNANWIPSPDTGANTRTRILCRGCSTPDVDEPNLPISIQQVTVTIGAPNSGISGTRQISATATYTYTP